MPQQQGSTPQQPESARPTGQAVQGEGTVPQGPPIIVHCHLRWDFVWQRPQQIFTRLCDRHPVLFVEEPVWDDGSPRSLQLSEPQPGIVRAIPVLPGSLQHDVDAQAEATRQLLAVALDDHPLLAGRFDDPIQWFYSPMTAPGLLGRFGEVGIVYDCMDELAAFRFAPTDIAAREQYVLSRADVVFTGGYQLYASKSRHHGNVHFHGCGVDVEHYRRARLPETVLPDAVRDLPGPVLGYFGVIDERIDYALIDALARAMPQASVVMAGPLAKVDPAALPDAPNIHWLGQRSYDELPALVKAFDVCLMPFALNDATRHINPTKTLEYMAGGKPIVSTAVPDVVRNFTPIVTIAESPEDFVAAVQAAVRAPDQRLIRQGIARANTETWDAIVAQMRAEMLEAIVSRASRQGPGAAAAQDPARPGVVQPQRPELSRTG